MKKANEKILDRVRKLLAMSKDSSSPNEAAIATGRARKLMDEYQISEMDLTTIKDDELGTSSFSTGKKSYVTLLGRLATAVAKLNDCIVAWDTNHTEAYGHVDLKFKGFFIDAVCATEMMKYLRDEMYRQANDSCEGRRQTAAYRHGFVGGVHSQVRKIMKDRKQLKTSNGTSLIVIKDQLVTAKYGVARYNKGNSHRDSWSNAYSDGFKKGQSTSLNRQVSGKSQQQLGN